VGHGILQAIVFESKGTPRARERWAARFNLRCARFVAERRVIKEKAATRWANRGFSSSTSSMTARNRPPVGPSIWSAARSPPLAAAGFVRGLLRSVTLQRKNYAYE